MHRIIQFAFILFSVHLYGQSEGRVTGTVLNAHTGEPVANAHISIKHTTFGTTTGTDGKYVLAPLQSGEYTLTANHIGYQQKTLFVRLSTDQPARYTFFMVPDIIQLPSVTVQGERNALPRSLVQVIYPGSAQTAANDAADLLESIPHVEIMRHSGPLGQKTVSIRGTHTSQVLIIVDGIPINDPQTGTADLSLVPAKNIERIEIHKGSASSRFGSGAIGGAIIIYTKADNQNTSRFSIKSGAYGFYDILPAITRKLGPVTIEASFRQAGYQGDFPFTYHSPGNHIVTENRLNNAGIRRQGFFQISSSHKEHRLRLQGKAGMMKRGLPGKIFALTPYARLNETNQSFLIEYKYLSNTVFSKIISHYSFENNENVNIFDKNIPAKYRRYPGYHYYSSHSRFLISSETIWQFTDWTDFSLLVNKHAMAFWDKNPQGHAFSPIGKAENHSFSAVLSQNITFDFSAMPLMIHIDHSHRLDIMKTIHEIHSREEKEFSPSLGARVQYGKACSIFAHSRIAKGFRTPTFSDLFYEGFRSQGVPYLEPEKSLTIDFSIGLKMNVFGTWQAEYTRFDNKIENLIVWRLGSFEIFRPFNADARVSGSELSLFYEHPSGVIKADAGYTKTDPVNKTDHPVLNGKKLSYRPLNTFKSSLTADLKTFSCRIYYRYIGKTYTNDANTSFRPAYHVIDIDLTKRVKPFKLPVNFEFSILNLTDEKIEIIERMPLPGREWRAGFSIKLD